MTDLSPILTSVEGLLNKKLRVVLALDGMAAAGKTTAANVLAARWNAPVVHMDDFFLPSDLRTPERLAEPGGNIHYERFREEVIPGLQTGDAFSYGVFDCSVMAFGGTRAIPAAPVVIVEGAYALHPVLEKYWDISVFFSIDPETQEARIRRRNGDEAWNTFQTRWIPMENAYHAAFDLPARADIGIHTHQ